MGNPDPTIVYIVQQATTLLVSLGMIAGTVFLAINNYVHDGEVVTLLISALGVHVVTNTKSNLPQPIATDKSYSNGTVNSDTVSTTQHGN